MTEQLVEAMDTAPTISMREAKDLLAKSQSQAFDLVCSLRTFEETHGWKHITDRTGEYYRSFKDFISGEFKTSQANYLTQKFRQETIAQVEAIKPPALDISGNSAVHLSARLPEDQASQKKVLEKAAEMFPDARLTTKHIDAALEEALPDKKIPPPDRKPLGGQFEDRLVDPHGDKYVVTQEPEEDLPIKPQFCSTSEDGTRILVNVGTATYYIEVEEVEELMQTAQEIRESRR